jgi:hypothetical protein
MEGADLLEKPSVAQLVMKLLAEMKHKTHFRVYKSTPLNHILT